MTVIDVDDDILGDIDKSSCKVTCLSGLESRIGETLTCTVGGDEELDDRETFLEVRLDREFDDITARACHESSHCTELSDLGLTTAGTGNGHEIERVESVLALFQLIHEGIGKLIVGLGPETDDTVVSLFLSDLTGAVLADDLALLLVGLLDKILLGVRNDHI